MLKNYGLLSLAWLVPASLLMGAIRIVYLSLGRRFDEALDVVAAWWWNLAHLPGTMSRRRQVQKARRVRDRVLRPFMESPGVRSPRWFATAERILEEQRAIDEADEGEPIQRRLRDRTASLVGTHPVIVASLLAIVVGAVAVRELVGLEVVAGGALPAFPARAGDLIAELTAAVRSTPLGGPLAPSPAIGALGALSMAAFGDPSTVQKAVLLAGPPLAAILMYRAAVRRSVRPGPAVIAAAAYGLGALTLWSFSDGRLGLSRRDRGAPRRRGTRRDRVRPASSPGGRRRFVAGSAVTLAVGIAAFPGFVLAIVLLVAISVCLGPARLRGLLLVSLSVVGAAVLLFPFVPTLLADGGRALGSLVGTTEPERLARLSLGPGPGTWAIAAFLPIGAAIGLGLVRGSLRGPAVRAAVGVGAGLILSWLAAANYLPPALSSPPAFAAVAAVSMATLIGFGLTSFTGSLRLESFGMRQVAGGVLAVVLGAGILPPVGRRDGRDLGRRVARGTDPTRVDRGERRGERRRSASCGSRGIAATASPPAGDPQRRLEGGPATIRYAVTDREGATVLDLGRPFTGPGPDHLDQALREILAGSTRHGGALLAPFGVRFVVAASDAIPDAAREALDAQIDVNLVPAAHFPIYRNSVALPPAASLETDAVDRKILGCGNPSAIEMWRSVPAAALAGRPRRVGGPRRRGDGVPVDGIRRGMGARGHVRVRPEVAFGWATSFRTEGEPVRDPTRGSLPARMQAVLLDGSSGSSRSGRRGSRWLDESAARGTREGTDALRARVRRVPGRGDELARSRRPEDAGADRGRLGAVGCVVCPHGGGPDLAVALFLANPGARRPSPPG